MIASLYKHSDCSLKLYDKIEGQIEKESETDVKEALNDLLNVVL